MAKLSTQQALDLALGHHHAGRLEEARTLYRIVLQHDARNPELLHLLGLVSYQLGEFDDAIEFISRAIAIKPSVAEYHNHLGSALRDNGRLDEAIAACRQAIELRQDYPMAHFNLGNALKDKKQFAEAMESYARVISLMPDFPEVYGALGETLRDQGRLDEAIEFYRKAVAMKPDFYEVYNGLGNAFKEIGQLDEAIAAYRLAIAAKADYPGAHSNLLLALHYHSESDSHSLLAEHRRWARQHAESVQSAPPHHPNDRDPERRLRIGYVSPDLWEHAVARFLLPLLGSHDHINFEIFCYDNSTVHDATTRRLRELPDQWRSIAALTDDQTAELIRQDGIDILVDLAMHTAGNRLLVFARKPAPVQVTYLAYCSTTGLAAMDYRITDPYLDPPGVDDGIYCEQSIRLPRTYWCYEPNDLAADVNPLPALTVGHITFGCLNNFCKITPATLKTWCALLRALPESRLILHAIEGSHRLHLRELFAREGIDPERLRFTGRTSIVKYFQLYQSIDIALDPFPFGGGTTTCDALWMGVPVVSLAGKTAVGRGGLSILSNVGLPELVAKNPEEYVRIAIDLATPVTAGSRLAELRSTLRQRMRESPLLDAPGFARDMEAAYRAMWRRWCAGKAD